MVDSGRQILPSATLRGSSAGHAGPCRRSIQPRLTCELRLETFGILPGTRGVFRRKRLLVIIIATVYYLQASNPWEQSTVAE